ncbi:MAG: hypothetical protein ACD_3C00182G0002 [uncultured bacterium (gcode 4)]|uniref:Uncharacterized protein n=1 Tax=uncultured bacterium (gcode 4) TaxID=1234023 RepID=K2F9A0_9BACT|nr:MAG: hypothetical protein ACD_3C00182G0002 [uncultured bacterium (gcode 4)]
MNSKFILRFIISIFLGIIFGLVCVILASSWNPWIWWTPQMWSILYNRFLIWVVIAVVWVHTFHPLFWFRMYPFLRGAVFWVLISIDLAIWIFISPMVNAVSIFWLTIIAWAIYWLIIDVAATRLSGEWIEILGKR